MPTVVWTLYGLGVAVMLVAMTSSRVSGWAAIGLWAVGLAVFVLGIVLEERGQRRRV